MKKLWFFALAIFTFCYSCDLTSDDPDSEILSAQSERPKEPEFMPTISLPPLPLTTMHILQREFVHHAECKGLSRNRENELAYIEERLISLYPDQFSKGMLLKMRDEVEAFKKEYAVYEKLLDQYNQRMGIKEVKDIYIPFTSLEDEIGLTQMTDAEIAKFNELEAIATRPVPVTTEELDEIAGISSEGRPELAPTIFWNSVAAAVEGYSVYRILEGRDRAELLREEFYGNRVNGGRSDAFEHIYVNVFLRRFITKAGAAIIADQVREEWLSPNEYAGDTEMDLHNNKIGRDTKYSHFRGDYLDDLWAWRTWGTRVRDYINGHCSNGADMSVLAGWNPNTDVPETRNQARQDIGDVFAGGTRYVHYVGGCELNPCWGVQCLPGYICINGNCVADPFSGVCPNVPCPPGTKCKNGECVPI